MPGRVDKYFRMSGTSMASPVVAGAAALMLQKDPSLTPDQVKYRLMKTATKSFPLYTRPPIPSPARSIPSITTCFPWARGTWM